MTRWAGSAGLALACAAFLGPGAAGTSIGWSIQPAPSPSATSTLNGVSCTSQNACTAVGSYQPRSVNETLAERWNGRKWTRQSTPNPAGLSPQLSAVSCPRASYCVAVGSTGDGVRTLAEQWNRRAWRIQASGTGGGGWLNGVSCSSPTACTAVGFTGFGGALAERWNGIKWKVQRLSSPADNSGLTSVSCPSATDCTAVGFTGTGGGTFAEQWDGSRWTLQNTHGPAGFSFLYGVSCSAADACTATGYFQTGSATDKTLAERWNGRRWARQPMPNSTTGNFVNLAGVSCPSSSVCTATGYYFTRLGQRVLAERWSGGKWMVQRTPNPKGTFSSQLNGVACPSAANCFAAGSYVVTFLSKTLAERYHA